MIEKVNPQHPDKVADRIAGALVDYAYTRSDAPKVAFEVLLGHGNAFIIAETSEPIPVAVVEGTVKRIAGKQKVTYIEEPQDSVLSFNQADKIRAGDNGIFKGMPVNKQVAQLSEIARSLYEAFPTDGKYILAGNRLIVCQSNAPDEDIRSVLEGFGKFDVVINPLGYWTGGTDVDTGAVNRKLGSDMGEAVTGGGLHGKDLSKADAAVNIYAHLLAQAAGTDIQIHCAIGDEEVGGVSYEFIVEQAREYIQEIGGFEKLAEWGLV